LKGTGIALMEKGISQRRPDYVVYQRSTSAFFPAPPSEAVNRGLYD
jgi:steroid 5-alpha reductase family enzyme